MAHNAWSQNVPLMQNKLEHLLRAVAAEPHAYEFFQLMRRIDAICSDRPRLGESSRPSLDRVRIGQQPAMAFPTRSVARVTEARENHPPQYFHLFLRSLRPQRSAAFASDRVRTSSAAQCRR
ncbi:type VI secretion system baseplate subunit TssG [Sinorhizobium medicae]